MNVHDPDALTTLVFLLIVTWYVIRQRWLHVGALVAWKSVWVFWVAKWSCDDHVAVVAMDPNTLTTATALVLILLLLAVVLSNVRDGWALLPRLAVRGILGGVVGWCVLRGLRIVLGLL